MAETTSTSVFENRRRWERIPLAVPVSISYQVAADECGTSSNAWCTAVSVGGMFMMTKDGQAFRPEEILAVSMRIPREARRAFPFSHVAGHCRIVRIEPTVGPEGRAYGLALAWCEDSMTFLGAMLCE